MPKFIPYKNKDGKIVSYQIQVSRGYDTSGNKIKPYTMSWKIPESFKSERAIQKELQKIGHAFEIDCKRGANYNDKRTFREYAEYYMEMVRRDNKIKTAARYNRDLQRVNHYIGDIPITALTIADLNKMYLQLQKEGIRKDQKAVAKHPEKIIELQKSVGSKNKDICAAIDIADNTFRNAKKGLHISLESAEKIASYFNFPVKQLFLTITLGDDTKGLSAKTIRNYHDMIHVILSYATVEHIIPENVADFAKPPSVEKKEADFFEIEEILQIRDALNSIDPNMEKYKYMLYLLIDLGIRRGELFGLCRNDFDFNNNTILIRHNIQHETSVGLYDNSTKGNKPRCLSLSNEVAFLMADYIERQNQLMIQIFGDLEHYFQVNKEGYIFTQSDFHTPMYPSSLNQWVKKFEEKYQLPHIYPHKFRHSQASILYAEHIDILTISKRLGHAQVSTTQNIYSHLLIGQDRKASDAISNVLYFNNR